MKKLKNPLTDVLLTSVQWPRLNDFVRDVDVEREWLLEELVRRENRTLDQLFQRMIMLGLLYRFSNRKVREPINAFVRSIDAEDMRRLEARVLRLCAALVREIQLLRDGANEDARWVAEKRDELESVYRLLGGRLTSAVSKEVDLIDQLGGRRFSSLRLTGLSGIRASFIYSEDEAARWWAEPASTQWRKRLPAAS